MLLMVEKKNRPQDSKVSLKAAVRICKERDKIGVSHLQMFAEKREISCQ